MVSTRRLAKSAQPRTNAATRFVIGQTRQAAYQITFEKQIVGKSPTPYFATQASVYAPLHYRRANTVRQKSKPHSHNPSVLPHNPERHHFVL